MTDKATRATTREQEQAEVNGGQAQSGSAPALRQNPVLALHRRTMESLFPLASERGIESRSRFEASAAGGAGRERRNRLWMKGRPAA